MYYYPCNFFKIPSYRLHCPKFWGKNSSKLKGKKSMQIFFSKSLLILFPLLIVTIVTSMIWLHWKLLSFRLSLDNFSLRWKRHHCWWRVRWLVLVLTYVPHLTLYSRWITDDLMFLHLLLKILSIHLIFFSFADALFIQVWRTTSITSIIARQGLTINSLRRGQFGGLHLIIGLYIHLCEFFHVLFALLLIHNLQINLKQNRA